MTTSTQWYLDIIERELSDLPADERAELLEDLAAHFSEFESDDDLVATLGDPVGYARELRDAAGLSVTPLLDTHVSLVDRMRANVDALRRSAWWRAVAAFLPELRPAWWVLRAWLIVGALAGGIDFPIPRVGGSTLIGLAALLLIVPVSVKLGRQALLGHRKGLNVALTAFGALFCLILPASASDDSGGQAGIPSDSTTMRSPTTAPFTGPSTPPGLLVYDSAGSAYSVVRVRSTSGGHAEVQAMCPVDVWNRVQPQPGLRTADGTPIVCLGLYSPGPSQPLTTATAPATTATPATTVAPATTAAPSTTEPASTVAEPTR